MTTDLELIFKALQAKQQPYSTAWDYYDGHHPLIYSTERLREIFRGLRARFSENWCAVVVDAAAERVSLSQFVSTQDQGAADRLNALWQSTGMHLDDDDAHLAALVCGEAFLMAWRDEESGEIEAYYNDPRLCHIEYDAAHPRRKRLGAKWWSGEDGKRYLNLYYPERIEYYVSRGKAENVSSAKHFREAAESEINPFGEIPLFHLRRTRRAIVSELGNVIEPQNAINKLLADMMVAAEFGAFRQRYAITNADTSELPNTPGVLWEIPKDDGDGGEPTQVGEFSPTELSNYLDAIDKLALAIGVITRTPKHYFFAQGGDPSGEALIALEAPLNKKCERYIERFSSEMRAFGTFLLKLDGHEVDPLTIRAIYAEPRTVQPLTQAQIRETNVRAGVPLKTQLREEGKSEAYLDQLDADRAEEQAAAEAALGQAMARAQRGFDQGGAR